ncbi:FAMILY PROTEIN putative (DUF2921)-RELATED [Salix koriyanagi]|uniref:RING-type E3 ubiquitin transferase n=1 Tax=Salix koriyanagi TaxID=2511006 RepID=A0A9Q0T067_9ROSI|nr:FAMILY PROTEIN putative (DUF2921)-RELATED [Salix koriyanagi]
MTSNSAPSTWCYLSWLHTAMFLVLSTTFYTPILVSSKIDIRNYNKHCASVVPESTPNDVPEFTTIPFAAEQGGYFLGGEDILNHPNSSRNYYPSSSRRELFIHTHNVYSTDADDVYKVEASLILKTSDMAFYMYDDTSPRGPLSFEVEGFWSGSTGKLCMVGSGSSSSEKGKHHVLPALLKLDGVRDSSNISSLIGGTLESLSTAGDSGYFKPISLLMIPQNHYEYTEVGKALDHVCTGGVAVPKSLSQSLKLSTPICNAFSPWDIAYKLEYSSGCNSTSSCNPFGEGAGYLPQIMSLKVIQCLEDIRRLRFQIEFSNSSYADYYYRPFNPNTTLVAEASWDVNKNQLCVVGCRIFNPANSLKKSRIEDCSVRLSFRFPSVWSIGHTSGTVGHIWSHKRENDPGYFKTIMFRSDENAAVGIPGSKYEYTVVDKARKSCTEKQPRKSKGKRHPDANSNDMRFDMAVRNSKRRRIGWGRSEPIAVGDQISRRDHFVISSSSGAAYSPVKGETNNSVPLNISYSMSFPLKEYSSHVEVFSEGIYDAETGKLCMVGCRYLDSNNRTSDIDSMDCKILINVQFPPVDSNDHIQGTIESTGKKNDPLYFEPLSFSAVSYYRQHSRESIWRMDLEIVMSLISNTLVCVFVGCQILYVKKHPAVFPFISLIMLAVLALGCMIPLMLNFEALFVPKDSLATAYRRNGGWVEANEVIVRVIMMVAFLLQFRLLQLVWSARSADGKQKAFLAAEMRTLYLCLPLYICGGLIAVYVNSRGNKADEATGYAYSSSYQRSLWADLRSYGGLVLDGFLFPQILLNIFHNKAENALSRFFYVGNTFVRLLPHAYDLYRAHFYVEDFDGSYMYAEPGGDYFSTAWDVIIPLVTLLFAAVVYLQQRFGGRCFMPKRLQETEGYEKVPVASDHA